MNIIASKKWKNNIICITNLYDDIYDNMYKLHIQDQHNKILTTYKLPSTRIYFGSITLPNDNMFIFVHYKYNEQPNKCKPTLYIEFYEINDNNEINKAKEYVIESEFSCGETEGRLCKINDDLFTVIWGDRTNYKYYNLLTFNKIKYEDPIELSYDVNIEACYFMDPNLILESNVTVYKEKYISIKINNYVDKNQGYIFLDNEIELPFNHRFNFAEIDSYIISFLKNNDDEYICEIRIELESKIDLLHIDYFNINLLLNITKNTVINISDKNRYNDILFFY